jgi:hypothetical protein
MGWIRSEARYAMGRPAPGDEAGRLANPVWGRGEMTGNAKRIRFCFGSAPPTVAAFLSRKISSVVYWVDIFLARYFWITIM